MELYGFHNFAWKPWNVYQDFFFFEKTVKIKVLQPPPCTISLPFFVFCIYLCELECGAWADSNEKASVKAYAYESSEDYSHIVVLRLPVEMEKSRAALSVLSPSNWGNNILLWTHARFLKVYTIIYASGCANLSSIPFKMFCCFSERVSLATTSL